MNEKLGYLFTGDYEGVIAVWNFEKLMDTNSSLNAPIVFYAFILVLHDGSL